MFPRFAIHSAHSGQSQHRITLQDARSSFIAASDMKLAALQNRMFDVLGVTALCGVVYRRVKGLDRVPLTQNLPSRAKEALASNAIAGSGVSIRPKPRVATATSEAWLA
jgi:hypothetical protein